MGPLGRRAWRLSVAAVAAVLAVASGAGLIRLLPWLLAPQVPFLVAVPFARALVSAAVETGVLLGPSLGFVLAAARLVELGEARALHGLGASPIRVVSGATGAALVLAASAFAVLVLAGAGAKDPGRFAAEILREGRASCAHARSPRSAQVPLVRVTWLCFAGAEPRLVGALPGGTDVAWFTARDLRPSPDLRSFQLDDLRLASRRTDSAPALTLRARHATIGGLAPWGRPASLAPIPRAALVCSVGALLALLGAWTVVARGVRSGAAALAIGAAPSLGGFAMLHAVDARSTSGLGYVLVPVAGVAAWAVVALLARAALTARVARRWRW